MISDIYIKAAIIFLIVREDFSTIIYVSTAYVTYVKI